MYWIFFCRVYLPQLKLSFSIDGSSSKRGMNGDIILRKVRLSPMQVASMVDRLDCGGLDHQELKSLYEFIPTRDEKEGLSVYFRNSKSQIDALADLTPCEQYMVALMVRWRTMT